MEIKGDIYCAGVYGMREKGSDKYLYIGSGLEINDCLSRHLYFLKRGLYADKKKAILQEKYDLQELVFEVIKESCHTKISEMSKEEKENLNKALSVLEQFYIEMYKDSVCNTQKVVNRTSSNRDELSTIKRKRANIGSNNPNSRYNEMVISNILWLKMNGYKAKEIEEMYKDIGIRGSYIYLIGAYKWIHLKPIKPSFIA